MRDCGECIACCVYLKIPALDKPKLTHCQHLNLVEEVKENTMQLSAQACGSCGIYEDRPQVCKTYACAWLLGGGRESDRPDRSKMLIDTLHQIENAVECKPLYDGAQDTKKGKGAIRRIARDGKCTSIVLDFLETKILRVEGSPP